MTTSETPAVYTAISAVTRALARHGIAKARHNADSGYAFRGIDDIYAALAPLLARHKLCLLPRMLEREQRSHRTNGGDLLFSVCVKARFEIVSTRDGSAHSVETFGEAMDTGDKATNKAMSAAYKYAVIQTFCVPVGPSDDADAVTPPRLTAASEVPVEGWIVWAEEIRLMIASCQSQEAIDRVQTRHRDRLRALSRAEPDIYASLGHAIQGRRSAIAPMHREAA